MKNILLILLIVLSGVCPAQKQANIWHFGDGQSIDFSNGTPVSTTGSQISATGASASYADKFGNLLFYTNGGGDSFGTETGHIWNSNNAVMYDMLGIQGGGFYADQSAVIFEAPGQDSVYYVFTMEDWESYPTSTRGLSYFTVDMRLNGGLGGVVMADVPVYAPSVEGLCAVRHANGRDYWIIIYQDSIGLGVYSVTQNGGVALAGIYTGAGPYSLNSGGLGLIKASPNGAYVAAFLDDTTNLNRRPMLMQFNNSTGQLSLPIQIPTTTNLGYSASMEFSPNSRFLYTIQGDSDAASPVPQSIVQFDLQAPNIIASAQVIYNGRLFTFLGGLQLAPDGKIYFINFGVDSLSNPVNALGRIVCANSIGSSVEFNVFNYSNGRPGAPPNYPAWLFENYDSTYVALGPDTIFLCDVGGSYVLNAVNPGATYLWSTGATSQTITVNSPGTYSVTVTGPCGTGSDKVVVARRSITYPPLNAAACSSYTAPWGTVYTQSGTYSDTIVSATGCDSIISVNLTITGSSVTPPTNVNVCSSYTAPWGTVYTQSGLYRDTLTTVLGCDSIISVNLTVLGSVTTPPLTVSACSSYTAPWGTIYTQSGTYRDTLLTVNGCDSIVSVNLTITGLPSVNTSSNPDRCNRSTGGANASVSNGTGGYTYTWSTGASGSTLANISSGVYTVTVTDQRGCTASASLTVGNIPPPVVNATSLSSPVVLEGDSVRLNASGALTFLWSPATGLSCTACPSPVASPPQTTTYVVTATDSNGCTGIDSITIRIDIRCDELFVPSAFSPNNAGPAVNEQLCVFSNCIATMDFAIYNRWGQLVFETNDQQACWDGTKDGQEVPTGVYAYRLLYKLKNGTTAKKSGVITLVR